MRGRLALELELGAHAERGQASCASSDRSPRARRGRAEPPRRRRADRTRTSAQGVSSTVRAPRGERCPRAARAAQRLRARLGRHPRDRGLSSPTASGVRPQAPSGRPPRRPRARSSLAGGSSASQPGPNAAPTASTLGADSVSKVQRASPRRKGAANRARRSWARSSPPTSTPLAARAERRACELEGAPGGWDGRGEIAPPRPRRAGTGESKPPGPPMSIAHDRGARRAAPSRTPRNRSAVPTSRQRRPRPGAPGARARFAAVIVSNCPGVTWPSRDARSSRTRRPNDSARKRDIDSPDGG